MMSCKIEILMRQLIHYNYTKSTNKQTNKQDKQITYNTKQNKKSNKTNHVLHVCILSLIVKFKISVSVKWILKSDYLKYKK